MESEVIQATKTDLMDILRNAAKPKACYSTKEVMEIFNFKSTSFLEYTNPAKNPRCLLRKVSGRCGQWTARSVREEIDRINNQ